MERMQDLGERRVRDECRRRMNVLNVARSLVLMCAEELSDAERWARPMGSPPQREVRQRLGGRLVHVNDVFKPLL